MRSVGLKVEIAVTSRLRESVVSPTAPYPQSGATSCCVREAPLRLDGKPQFADNWRTFPSKPDLQLSSAVIWTAVCLRERRTLAANRRRSCASSLAGASTRDPGRVLAPASLYDQTLDDKLSRAAASAAA